MIADEPKKRPVYDDNSNTLSVTTAGVLLQSNTYDLLGNLLTHTDGRGNTTTMMYNARDLVTHRVEPGGITGQNIDMAKTMRYFYYADGSVMNAVDQNGAVTFSTYDLNGKVRSQSVGGKITNYRYSGRGDVVQLTNSARNVTATYDYDAFGNLLSANDHPNPFRYCGEYWDYETKRYYFRARYYSPATGRFTQRDKFLGFYADPLSLNRYTYAHNNPTKYHVRISGKNLKIGKGR